jgi:hypothetical protein
MVALAADEVLQQTGHETGADVLEGECRAVEEFKRIDAVGDAGDGTVELKRVADDAVKLFLLDVLAEESVGHGAGNFLKRQPVDAVEEFIRQRFDMFGHVQSAVFGQSFDHGFLQIGRRGMFVGAVISHDFLFCCLVLGFL